MVVVGMSNVDMREFSSTSELDKHLADTAVRLLDAGIKAKGHAILVVSGGSTPLGFFQQLSQRDLDWEKVLITLADERWVDADHNDSNEKLVRSHLMVNKAADAQFLSLKNDADSAEEGAAVCDKQLADLDEFDLVILGMGGDGHTASLFPGASSLLAGLDLNSGLSAVAVTPLTAPHQRMSMTLPRLLKTRHLVVHITGADKRAVFEEAAALKDQTVLPISAVIQQSRVPLETYWAV